MLPGGVDVHTHLDADVGGLRSADDFESSTAAAACGGVTTICDYAWQQRGQSLTAAIEDWKTRAAGRAHVDYGFHVIVGDASDQTLAEIPRLVDLGYPSLKVFVINEFGIGDQGIMRALDAARKVGVVINVHAENGDMLDHCTRNLLAAGRRDPRYYAASRPVIAEAEATRRAIDGAGGRGDLAREVADRIVFMADGRIVEEGTPEQVLERPREARTQQFLKLVQD